MNGVVPCIIHFASDLMNDLMNSWKRIIPTELHSDFQRQVEEKVSAELMVLILNQDDPDSVDEAAEEAKLTSRVTEQFLHQFQAGRWPAKLTVNLGVRAGELMPASDHWICGLCRERNFNSFETCRKCSETRLPTEPKTVVVSAPHISKPTVIPTWQCRECSHENALADGECAKCYLNQDVYKRDTWPARRDIPDAAIRRELRLKLFRCLIDEFGVDDPFCSIDISQAEFVLAADRLKAEVLTEHRRLTSDPLIDLLE